MTIQTWKNMFDCTLERIHTYETTTLQVGSLDTHSHFATKEGFRDEGVMLSPSWRKWLKLEDFCIYIIYIYVYTCRYVYTLRSLRCWGHSGISGWEPSLPSAAQHFGVQWNLTNTHICSTKRNLVCDGLKWTLAQTFVKFRRLLAFRRSEAPKETGAIWGGESQVGPWFHTVLGGFRNTFVC